MLGWNINLNLDLYLKAGNANPINISNIAYGPNVYF